MRANPSVCSENCNFPNKRLFLPSLGGVTDTPIAQIVLPKSLLRLVDRQSVEFMELVESVRAHGVLLPILVRRRADGRWEVIDGLHRLTAASEAGHTTVPCRVIQATDEEAALLTVQLNAIGKDTLPCEYAGALRRYLKLNPELTIAGLSRRVNKSPAWIAGCLSLTYLSDDMQKMVNRGEMPLQSAYLLVKIPRDQRKNFVDQARTMSARKFREIATVAIRQYHDAIRQGRLQRNYADDFVPRTWLRTLQDIRKEEKLSEKGISSVLSEGCKTPLDGWRAAIRWVLHIDPDGLAAQRRLHESHQRGALCDPPH